MQGPTDHKCFGGLDLYSLHRNISKHRRLMCDLEGSTRRNLEDSRHRMISPDGASDIEFHRLESVLAAAFGTQIIHPALKEYDFPAYVQCSSSPALHMYETMTWIQQNYTDSRSRFKTMKQATPYQHTGVCRQGSHTQRLPVFVHYIWLPISRTTSGRRAS